MRTMLKFAAGLFLTGMLIFISCKKKIDVLCSGCAGSNKAPVAKAGANLSIVLPLDTAILDGSASIDPDGIITAYNWRKISGPASYAIVRTDIARTSVRSLVMGVYQFELTVTDDKGLTGKDTMQVIVDDPAVNQAPVCIAGSDQIIILPVDSILLNGSLSMDPDGSIVSWLWRKISGPVTFSIATPASALTWIKGLTSGVYRFELKVTDNGGAFSLDTVQVTVINLPSNLPPVSQAGIDQSIYLPVNSALLNGSGSHDPDNNITGYIWAKVSGPASYNMSTPNAVQTTVTNLTQGTYLFELKVTDAFGLFDLDTMEVRVIPGPGTSRWTALPYPGFTASFIIGIDASNIFVGTGFNPNFRKYDALLNTWIPRAGFPVVGDEFASFSLNGKGYVGMGYYINNSLNLMHEYDPVSNQWTQKNNTPTSGWSSPLVINGSAYLLNDPSIWLYNSAGDTYTPKGNYPFSGPGYEIKPRFALNGMGYTVTGASCWRYDPSSDLWQQRASLPAYVKTVAGFSSQNNGYVLVDSSQSSYLLGYPLQLWQYEPLANQWQRIYDDYPGAAVNAVKSISVGAISFVGLGTNTGDWPIGDMWRFQ